MTIFLLYFIQWNNRNYPWVILVLIVHWTSIIECSFLFIYQTRCVKSFSSYLLLAVRITQWFLLSGRWHLLLSFNFTSFVSASSSTYWPAAIFQPWLLLNSFTLFLLLIITFIFISVLIPGLNNFRILESTKLARSLTGMAVFAIIVLVLIHIFIVYFIITYL
jgi:hypothetical protein